MRKILSIFKTASLVILIAMVALLILTVFNPMKNISLLRVMSGSMEPMIKTGSVVLVVKTDPNSLKKGDVINFQALGEGGISVTHRISEVVKKDNIVSFKTKGDANNSGDVTEVAALSVKGKAIFSVPYLGYVSEWMRKPAGFILLVILPAAILIISEIINIKKSIEEEILKKYSLKNTKSPNDREKNMGFQKLTILTLLLLCNLLFGSIFLKVKPVVAFFSDFLSITGNTFVTSIWENDLVNQTVSPTLYLTLTFTPTPTSEINQNIVINEFMPDPDGGNEWVEIYNNSDKRIDILDWYIKDDSGVNAHKITIKDNFISGKSYKIYYFSDDITLNDTGDTVYLINKDGTEIDKYQYRESIVQSGKSIGRKPDGTGDFIKCATPSAGFANESC